MQSAPSEMPKDTINMTKTNISIEEIWQIWQQKGQHCPNGTIPIRRTTVHDVLRAKSLDNFGKKKPSFLRGHPIDQTNGNEAHEYAVAKTTASQYIYGAKAKFTTWHPQVEDGEFSLSQIWVVAGPFVDLNSVECGWQVYPDLYDDDRPRLFVYWTSDGYKSTGCYNELCPGFVQINQDILVGGAIEGVSTIDGHIYEMSIQIWRDKTTGNWWVSCRDAFLGYWPRELFTHLEDKATRIEWGGEIIDDQPNEKHTLTQMGSGRFAQEGYGKASFFRNLQIVDSNNNLIRANNLVTFVNDPNCYNIQLLDSTGSYGHHFYYGGPGRNPNCP